MSNVVEYDFKGNVIQNFAIVGHNDGLRYDPATKSYGRFRMKMATPTYR